MRAIFWSPRLLRSRMVRFWRDGNDFGISIRNTVKILKASITSVDTEHEERDTRFRSSMSGKWWVGFGPQSFKEDNFGRLCVLKKYARNSRGCTPDISTCNEWRFEVVCASRGAQEEGKTIPSFRVEREGHWETAARMCFPRIESISSCLTWDQGRCNTGRQTEQSDTVSSLGATSNASLTSEGSRYDISKIWGSANSLWWKRVSCASECQRS